MPDRIGDYELLYPLGAGAAGMVVAVQKDGVKYAMKIIDKDQSPLITYEKVQKEYAIVKSLEELEGCEKGIICYRDLFEDEHKIYLVMEFLEGYDLTHIWESRELTKQELVQIFSHLALILSKLHQYGVAHRDVKLENIMFTADKLTFIDFGLACQMCTVGIIPYGTPRYSPPETWGDVDEPVLIGKDALAVWKKRDVWALGVVFYELATNEDYVPDIDDPDLGFRFKLIKHPNVRKIVQYVVNPDPKDRPTSKMVYDHINLAKMLTRLK